MPDEMQTYRVCANSPTTGLVLVSRIAMHVPVMCGVVAAAHAKQARLASGVTPAQ